MLEDGRTVAGEMRVEGDPVAGAAEQIGEHSLAALERLPPEVLAVDFDQVRAFVSCRPRLRYKGLAIVMRSPPNELEALDRWINAVGGLLSRQQAIRRILSIALGRGQ